MKKLVILGAGTGGTIMANKLAPVLDNREWQITIVDKDEVHHYQPGYLFIPFNIYSKEDVIKARRDFFPAGIGPAPVLRHLAHVVCQPAQGQGIVGRIEDNLHRLTEVEGVGEVRVEASVPVRPVPCRSSGVGQERIKDKVVQWKFGCDSYGLHIGGEIRVRQPDNKKSD